MEVRTPEEIDVRQCSSCYMIHESFEEAINCCPPKTLTAYKCPECDDLHVDIEDAKECCA